MMRGRGEAKYRRGASPGRWEGNERGRAFVEAPDSGRSASRSRSPPHRARPHMRGPPPARKEGPPVRAPVRSYSSSDSSPSRGNSPSRSSSSSEGHRAAGKKPPLPGAHKKEIVQQKKKEKEILSRLQSAEEELQAERSSREALQAKAEFLSEKVKTVAERSKNRGQMLVRLIQGIRQISEAKTRLGDAESELETILEAATALMQNEEQSTRPQQETSVVKTENPTHSEGANANHQPQLAQWNAAAAVVSQPQAHVSEPADMKLDEGGRWTEAADMDAGVPGPKNMRSFKFNIKLPS